MDGITEVTDLDKTAANKKLVTDFLKAVSVEGDKTKIDECVAEGEVYIQHNAMVGDERDFSQGCGPWTFKYTKTQIVVAESKSSLAHATQHHGRWTVMSISGPLPCFPGLSPLPLEPTQIQSYVASKSR